MSLCIPAPEDGSDPPIERMFHICTETMYHVFKVSLITLFF